MNMDDMFAEEEAKLLAAHRAERAAEDIRMQDPVYKARILADMAEKQAKYSDIDFDAQEEDDEGEEA